MVKVVQDDDVREFPEARVLALVGDVGEVLTQLLAGLVVDVERGDGAGSQLLARPE